MQPGMLRLLPLHTTFPAVLEKMQLNGPGKVEMRKEEIPGRSMYGRILTNSRLQRENFSQLWVLNRGDLNFCVRSTPLRRSEWGGRKEREGKTKIGGGGGEKMNYNGVGEGVKSCTECTFQHDPKGTNGVGVTSGGNRVYFDHVLYSPKQSTGPTAECFCTPSY